MVGELCPALPVNDNKVGALGQGLRYLSLFSGIEAATVAWLPLGWECVAVAEIEPFPSAVLVHHYPDTKNLGDITKITEADIIALGHIDIVVGGFPCQDVSVAGLRKGMHDSDGNKTRSGLFYDAMRIVRWAREYSGCRFILIENVPGLMSSNKGRDFAGVVAEICGAEFDVPGKGWKNTGVAIGTDGLVEWCCLDAQFFGVPQRRRRVFALGDFGDWSSRPPILFEPESLRGDTPPSRKTGERVAPCLGSGTKGSGGIGMSNQELFSQGGGGLTWPDESSPQYYESHPADSRITGPHDIGNTVSARSVTGGGNTPLVMAHGQGNAEIVKDGDPSLTCNHEAPIVCHGTQDPCTSDKCYALGRNSGQENVIAFTGPTCIPISDQATRHAGTNGSGANVGKGHGLGVGGPEDPMFTLTKGDKHAVCYPIDMRNATRDPEKLDAMNRQGCGLGNEGDPAPTVSCAHVNAVAAFQSMRESGTGFWVEDNISGTLDANMGCSGHSNRPATFTTPSMQVRRLTPTECERLQGFPDNYTRIPWRKKPAGECPDGPRYKALGNSMAVPCMFWLGYRISMALGLQLPPTNNKEALHGNDRS